MTGADDESPDGALLIRAIAAHDGVVGDPAGFETEARSVVREARRAGAVEALVVALRAVAWSERAQQRNVAALRLLMEASRLARRGGLPHRLGEVLTTRAAVNLELGKTTAARRDLHRAGELVTAADSPDLQLKRAVLLCNVGHVASGAEILREILSAPAAPVDVRTRAANNLALAESLSGEFDRALEHIDLAAALAREVGPAFVGFVAHNRGVVLAQSGRLSEALRQFDEAVQLLTAAGLPLGEFYAEHTETLLALRALPEAAELGRRAADALELNDVPLIAAEARLRLAEVVLHAGDAEQARAEADRAIGQFRSQRRNGWVALATVVSVEAGRQSARSQAQDVGRICRAADTLGRSGMVAGAVAADIVAGRVASAAGRSGTARRRWMSAYDRSREGPVLLRLQGRLAAGLAAAAADDGAGVLAHCRAGLDDLAAHRAALPSMELRALASGHGVELGRLGLGVLLRSRRPARTFDWTERTRAAALLVADPPAPDAVIEERAALAALRAELAEARRGTGVEPAALLARQAAGEARIRRATWSRRASPGTPGAVVPASAVRDLLEDRVLVSYVRHGADLLALVVDRTRTRVVELGPLAPLRFESDSLLFALRRLTRPGRPAALEGARASAEHALATLRRLAVGPLGLDPDVPLVVIPTSDTHRVPWSALHDGPVGVAPSASLWAATRRRRGAPASVLVVAGPDLPGAEPEAAAVAACHTGAVVHTGSAATTASVLEAMSGAGLVHLACHGVLRSDNPIFSSLQMADGPLTLHELDLRGIAPARMVLASCDSAADTSYAGDEVLGFVGALLSRGTAGLVASIVPVGDSESIALAAHLHRGLADGLRMTDALHRARAALDTSDPRGFVNWCGFTAYGGA
ncbi:CHAT domain-containing tetratricopeptide repeat protein [Pseudonocardia sp.]|uniref:CHAT domain-containing protein n=1 Tax=Pseudonocardia sp. TaxID=60912 RepID=UPI002637DB74|nr:CHAT domain-containing tetratricopeptide repeat protein [Pseudonocardia sp.]